MILDTTGKVAQAALKLLGKFTTKAATAAAGLPRTTTAYHLRKLASLGLLEIADIGGGRGHSTTYHVTNIDNLRKYLAANDEGRFEVEKEVAGIDNPRSRRSRVDAIFASRRRKSAYGVDDYEPSRAAQRLLVAISDVRGRYFTFEPLKSGVGRSVRWIKAVLDEIMTAGLVSVAREGGGRGKTTIFEVERPETVEHLAYG